MSFVKFNDLWFRVQRNASLDACNVCVQRQQQQQTNTFHSTHLCRSHQWRVVVLGNVIWRFEIRTNAQSVSAIAVLSNVTAYVNAVELHDWRRRHEMRDTRQYEHGLLRSHISKATNDRNRPHRYARHEQRNDANTRQRGCKMQNAHVVLCRCIDVVNIRIQQPFNFGEILVARIVQRTPIAKIFFNHYFVLFVCSWRDKLSMT